MCTPTSHELGHLLDSFASSAGVSREAVASARSVVTSTTTRAVLAGLGTEARVDDRLNVVVVGGRVVNGVPGSGTDGSVELQLVVGDLAAIAGVVQRIRGRRALNERAVGAAVAGVALATHLHATIPGTRVGGDVLAEEAVEGVGFGGLRGLGNGEIVGEVLVGSAGSVSRAVVRAGRTLARRAFVTREARADSGAAVADALVRALGFFGVLAHAVEEGGSGRVGDRSGAIGRDGGPGDAARARSQGAVSAGPLGGVGESLPLGGVLGRLHVASALVVGVAGTVA